jgi:hypothetical protein
LLRGVEGRSASAHPESYGQQSCEINATICGDAVFLESHGFSGWPARPQVDRELKMTVHAPKLLTPEEFASLIEIAITPHHPTVPPHHLSKLVSLGYVLETEKGAVVTGDGLIRITESE